MPRLRTARRVLVRNDSLRYIFGDEFQIIYCIISEIFELEKVADAEVTINNSATWLSVTTSY